MYSSTIHDVLFLIYTRIVQQYSYSPASVVPRLCVLLFLYTCVLSVQYIHSNERDFQKLVKGKNFVYVFSCIYKISCMYVYTRYTIHDTRYTIHDTRYTISTSFVYTRSHLWSGTFNLSTSSRSILRIPRFDNRCCAIYDRRKLLIRRIALNERSHSEEPIGKVLERLTNWNAFG